MSFSNFIKELNGDRVEGELLKTSLFSLVSSFAIFFLLYFLFLRGADSGNKIFFIFMSILSYALILPAIRQVQAYKMMPCMSGMMIGMTIGMVAGFLPSYYLAATNGMFYGAVWGMILGIFFGYQNGKCCGVMGVMEGVMAGFMGGLMGSMTSIMLLNDHLIPMSIIVFVISAIIIFALNYMIYKEMRNEKRQHAENYVSIILWSIILTAITFFVILFGPRGGIFA
ncbi:Uncharacterised protein [uncultured archaeon]|nr:Uncharacterised protein [uncultured archaeon]